MTNSAYVITRYDPLKTVIDECPRAGELLAEYGLHCVNCFANEYDTIEAGAQIHEMGEEEMQEMIDDINGQLDKEWREEQKRLAGTSSV